MISGDKKPPPILLVEDLDDAIFFIRKSFERAQMPVALQITRNGEQAISYLSGAGQYSNREKYPLPWLVLLDLKMPGVDGFEVLKWIRENEGLRSTLVVVLTSSDEIRDANHAYQLGANSFLVKPFDFENSTALANTVSLFWRQFNSGITTDSLSQPEEGI